MGKVAAALEKQIQRDLDASFQEFIKFIWLELSTEVVSPAYTGFFASSWKVDLQRPQPVDRVAKYEPWATIKREKGGAFPQRPPYIEPRFGLARFTSDDTVYIGNTAEYARWALQRPNQIVPFVARAKSAAKIFFGTARPGSIRVTATGSARGTRDRRVL